MQNKWEREVTRLVEAAEAAPGHLMVGHICRFNPRYAMAKQQIEDGGIGDIRAVWRHFVVDGKPLAKNFFAVGDASIRTNPLYGRGCSTGILHAHMLADVLTETSDPVERALAFDARTEEALRPIFSTSLSEDRNGIRRALASAEGRLLEKSFMKFDLDFL